MIERERAYLSNNDVDITIRSSPQRFPTRATERHHWHLCKRKSLKHLWLLACYYLCQCRKRKEKCFILFTNKFPLSFIWRRALHNHGNVTNTWIESRKNISCKPITRMSRCDYLFTLPSLSYPPSFRNYYLHCPKPRLPGTVAGAPPWGRQGGGWGPQKRNRRSQEWQTSNRLTGFPPASRAPSMPISPGVGTKELEEAVYNRFLTIVLYPRHLL